MLAGMGKTWCDESVRNLSTNLLRRLSGEYKFAVNSNQLQKECVFERQSLKNAWNKLWPDLEGEKTKVTTTGRRLPTSSNRSQDFKNAMKM
ncbi:hypothetical protein TNCV_4701471 [Trichonephila clavipes]|nr:hypothetical protein TNCV_4701471 [Trichonephila clavipes]